MPEVVQECPMCGANAHSPFDQREFRGILVTNIICRDCGLVYQSPRMTESERLAFYENGYRSLYQGQENPSPQDLAVQEARARVVLAFLAGLARPTSPILDIGCSAGKLLEQFQKQYQVQTYGVEPGQMYREYARSIGLEIYPSLEELQLTGPRRFSLVSMMHVVEHLPSPLAYLQYIRQTLLESGGWLLLEVPNLYAHDCFEVAHMVSYSAHTLSQLLGLAGYKIIKLRAHGLPRSRLIPLYLTSLAQPDPGQAGNSPVRSEIGIKLKRRLGLLERRLIENLAPHYAWQKI
jgi:2-polyprenyl-3-methyl-5-hydroxy-6-metoxy-1,4-benzoquinol methylase